MCTGTSGKSAVSSTCRSTLMGRGRAARQTACNRAFCSQSEVEPRAVSCSLFRSAGRRAPCLSTAFGLPILLSGRIDGVRMSLFSEMPLFQDGLRKPVALGLSVTMLAAWTTAANLDQLASNLLCGGLPTEHSLAAGPVQSGPCNTPPLELPTLTLASAAVSGSTGPMVAGSGYSIPAAVRLFDATTDEPRTGFWPTAERQAYVPGPRYLPPNGTPTKTA